jgi:hypothetical protein
MSLSHPNLVQCFHSITFTQSTLISAAASSQCHSSTPDPPSGGLDTLELPHRTVSIPFISMPERSSISGSMTGTASRGGMVGSFSEASQGMVAWSPSAGAGSFHTSAASFCDPSGLSMTLPTRGISSYSLGPQPSGLQTAAGCISGSSRFEDSALLPRYLDKQGATAAAAAATAAASAGSSSSQALTCIICGSGSSSSLPGPVARSVSADSGLAVSSYVLPSARTSLSSTGYSVTSWAGGPPVAASRCSGAAAAAETWCVITCSRVLL